MSGTVGLHPRLVRPHHIAFGTGFGPSVIRRSDLPQGWGDEWFHDQDLPSLGDANGNSLKLMGKIVLRVRLGSATYRVLFVVAEHLAVSVIIGTSFMNRNVKGIMTTQASCLVFIEPKHALQARQHVRTANSIVEVRKGEKFLIVLSNFSKIPRTLPKNMVIA